MSNNRSNNDDANKEVGTMYMDLYNYVRDHQEDYVKGDEGDARDLVSTAVNRADELLLHVDKAQDMKADAQIISQLSEVTYKRVKVTSGDSNTIGVTLDQFTERIKAYLSQAVDLPAAHHNGLDENEELETESAEQLQARKNLMKLGDLSNKLLNKAPSIDFMLGPLMLEKKRQTGRRATGIRMRINELDSTNPENLGVDDMQQGDESNTRLILEVYKSILKGYRENGQEPIPLYKVVLNPFSFAQSVENLFYVSFLVRDGRLSLDLNSGIPVISPVSEDDENENENEENKGAGESGDKANVSQVVIDLDIESWKGLIEVMEITAPFIKTRPVSV